MAIEQKKILIRRGNENDLVITDLQVGEPALTLDSDKNGLKGSGGEMLWNATANKGTYQAVLASEKDAVSGIPTLDANKKVKEDPASYGVANGAVLFPSAIPTVGKILKLGSDGKSVAEATFDDFATGYETGNNANGDWEKRPDGVMECWATISLTTDNNGYATWTFPVQFVSTDNLYVSSIVTTLEKSGGQYAVDGAAVSVTTSSVQFRFLFTNDSSASQSVTTNTIRLYAKGKWK